MSDSLPPTTPSQTVGPFFHHGMEWALTTPAPRAGDEWVVEGVLRDGHGDGVSDAVIETWQPSLKRADAPAGACGFQRAYTDDGGRFAFVVRRVEGSGEPVHVTIFARGLLAEVRTRFYPGVSADRLASLPELDRLPADRLPTLAASALDGERRVLSWSIRLQGGDETVFFAFP
jgi:protocatechuate 3,4-dioxygenase alpha subunit